MRVLIVDDHVLFRDGLVSLFDAQPDFQVVGQAGCVGEAIAQARELSPDMVLMDFGLPDGSGLEATRAILADQPETNIVFLTVHDEDERLFEAIRCGAKGYLIKNVPVSKLLAYLQCVDQGEAALSPALTRRLMDEFSRMGPAGEHPQVDVCDLTPREVEILQELATGATNQEIAHRLIIAENTVKNHVRSILTKLNLRNRREAASFAQQTGLIHS